MKAGSLCTGYGGLDMAVDVVLGTTTEWVCENDEHAAKVTAARFPGVPNLHDLTTVDWASVPPVDVLSAGYPCQPFSHAGRARVRCGMVRLYERATLAPVIDVPASSSSLPTPAAQEPGGTLEQYHDRLRKADGREPTFTPLGMLVKSLPTPTTEPLTGNGHARHLGGEVKTLGTPRVTTGAMGVSHAAVARGETKSRLENQVAMLPTPTAMDGRGSTTPESAGGRTHGGVNLPERIQRLRGATTDPPSIDTPPLWDELPLPLPTSEDDSAPSSSSG